MERGCVDMSEFGVPEMEGNAAQLREKQITKIRPCVTVNQLRSNLTRRVPCNQLQSISCHAIAKERVKKLVLLTSVAGVVYYRLGTIKKQNPSKSLPNTCRMRCRIGGGNVRKWV